VRLRVTNAMTSVKVAVRLRPFNERERGLKDAGHCISIINGQSVVTTDPHGKGNDHKFSFDHAFDSSDKGTAGFASQDAVFDSIGRDILDGTMAGYNGTVFAYGQTGSGKTYTMMGLSEPSEEKGVIPRLCEALFAEVKARSTEDPALRFEVQCAYMEIYNEKVFDLLDPAGGRHKTLAVRESPHRGPFVVGLTEMAVDSFEAVGRLMAHGNRLRHVASTAMNATSSRSHAVFELFVKQVANVGGKPIAKTARVNLVDLAGSERQAKTLASATTLKEGAAINQSLSTLGRVISALVKQQNPRQSVNRAQVIPYRNSTLTWLLKESFGGNAKTVMIATISPAADNYDETLSTLRYAASARQIKNAAVVNELAADRVVRELRDHVAELERRLADAVRSGAKCDAVTDLQSMKDAHEDMLRMEETDRDEKLARTQKHLEETAAQLEANHAVLARRDAELAQLRTKGYTGQWEVAALRAKLQALEEERSRQSQEHATNAARMQAQIDSLAEERDGLLTHVRLVEAERETLKVQVAQHRASITPAQSPALSRPAREISPTAESTVSNRDDDKEEHRRLQNTVRDLQRDLKQAQEDVNEARAKIEPLEAHVDKLRQQLLDGVDKAKWNPSTQHRLSSSHVDASASLIRPSTLAALAASNPAADLTMLIADEKAKLQRTVAELEMEVAVSAEAHIPAC